MDIPSHLSQPLSIDTNISYSLDLSKFPGLEDPQHKNQPALLIASCPVASSVTSSVLLEAEGTGDVIPSPTLDNTADDILQDLLSIIEKHEPEYKANITDCNYDKMTRETSPPNNHQVRRTQPHRSQPDPPCLTSRPKSQARYQHSTVFHSEQGSVEQKCLSKYALDAIYQNLIYPEVNRGHGFTLDTLVQSVRRDVQGDRVQTSSSGQLVFGDYITRLKSVTGCVGKDVSPGQNTRNQRPVKRKRSHDVSCDHDTPKRSRCDGQSNDVRVYCAPVQPSFLNNGGFLVNRRVRELMCSM
ncbi:uncharacterized protein LOC124275604 [Haliotis rubra]|uniref:uncharacterized protein LOC124275604 n=1 Tax=Haliotis rubra TaxID=36100 RepID=UPI001EE53464|nr:uncharacterized protein LOC124275604 [Haliotis rubra]